MGVAVMHLCGRGRGRSAQIVTLHCDAPDCRATVAASSVVDYRELIAVGWRVIQVTPRDKVVACPEHSEAEPTVPVQQELAIDG